MTYKELWQDLEIKLVEYIIDKNGNELPEDKIPFDTIGKIALAAFEEPSDEYKETQLEAAISALKEIANGNFDWFSVKRFAKKRLAALNENQPYKEEVDKGQRPKVICLCGSTRFAQWFMIKRWELEKQGIITFGINILPDNYFAEGNSHGAEQEGIKEILDELHKRKIDLSDEVFVLNVGGYIGESTRSEIDYAIKNGKPVNFLESKEEAGMKDETK